MHAQTPAAHPRDGAAHLEVANELRRGERALQFRASDAEAAPVHAHSADTLQLVAAPLAPPVLRSESRGRAAPPQPTAEPNATAIDSQALNLHRTLDEGTTHTQLPRSARESTSNHLQTPLSDSESVNAHSPQFVAAITQGAASREVHNAHAGDRTARLENEVANLSVALNQISRSQNETAKLLAKLFDRQSNQNFTSQSPQHATGNVLPQPSIHSMTAVEPVRSRSPTSAVRLSPVQKQNRESPMFSLVIAHCLPAYGSIRFSAI